MEVSVFSTITTKVYKESAIIIATFLGGPLVAGYLMAENFKHLGEPNMVKKTWLWSIIGFIVVMTHALTVSSSFPALVYNLIYVWLIDLLIKRYQSAQIIAHIKAGGPLFTIGRAVFVGIIGWIVLVAVGLICFLILGVFHLVGEF